MTEPRPPRARARTGRTRRRRPTALSPSARRAAPRPGNLTVGRIHGVCALVGLSFLGLLVRLTYIQWLHADKYTRGTAISRERTVTTTAHRGRLYDRDGNLLVDNEPGFILTIDPNSWFQDNATPDDSPPRRRARTIAELEKRFPFALAESRLPTEADLLPDGDDSPTRFTPVDLVRFVPAAQADELRQLALSGLGLTATTRRRAIDGYFAPQVVGFTGQDGRGLSGIEYQRDRALAGQDGETRCLADRRGTVPGSEKVVRALVPGQDLCLTLDSTLQHDVEQELARAVKRHAAESGVAVVLDARNGDILALANVPTFNVNNPSDPTELAGHPDRAASDTFEPGSILKTITLAAALESGAVRPGDTFHCTGEAQIGARTIHCAVHEPFTHGHGAQNLDGVLKYSCNVATARVGETLGAPALEDFLGRFGFGDQLGSGLPGEGRGHLPSRWSRIVLANVSFGQGISATALQIAAAYGAFADGNYRTPRIVRGIRDPRTGEVVEAPLAEPRPVLSPETAKAVRSMLKSVVEGGTGTKCQLDRYWVGGKTGTAQIAEGGRYTNKYFASFVGLAPIDKPEFVILVSIKAPKGEHWGGSVAGPVFKFIAERALIRRDVPVQHRRPAKGKAGGGSAAEA